MNKFFSFLTFAFLSLVFVFSVYAESFSVTHIGALATNGSKYTQWWYEPQNILLKGTSSKEANISIMIDGKKTETIKADSTGNWEHYLGVLEKADHAILMTSGEDKYSFVLTVGSSPPADMSGTKGGLPSAGQVVPFLAVVAAAGVLILYSFKKERA